MNKDDLFKKIKQTSVDATASTIDAIKKKVAIKKVGAIYIDEENKLFKIDPNINTSGHLVSKASLALMTGGLSLAGEAAVKGIKSANSQWIPFEVLNDYNYIINNEKVRLSEGGRVKISKGLYIGSSSSKTKNVTTSSYFELTLNSLDNPYIKIPIIKKALSGKEFDNAVKLEKETAAALNYILNNK